MPKEIINVRALLELNEDFRSAYLRGEQWARDHMRLVESINAGEPEGFRRKFDGIPRKWCGGSCPFPEGCVTCTLPEDHEVAKRNREYERARDRSHEGIIVIDGEITSAMTMHVQRSINNAVQHEVKRIQIKITSHGGLVSQALRICDAIREAPVEWRIGTVAKYALSSGLTILQACDERIGSPDAKFLLHHMRFNDVTTEMLRDRTRIDRMLRGAEPSEKDVYDLIVKRTGKTLAEVKAEKDRDKEMSAQEALEFGLIDRIQEC